MEPVTWSVGDVGSTAVLECHTLTTCSCFRAMCLHVVLVRTQDPTQALLHLADNKGMADRFQSLSLGQGQAPRAKKMIEEGVAEGNWVFLANCHLSLSWMPELDKLVEEKLQIQKPHSDFRLWLSSSPHPDFPIAILQAGIKMTTEPPKGLKANMKRLYQLVPEATFPRVEQEYAEDKYRRLLFGLCFFHSLLIERRKFRMLGWNVVYGFNDSDFEVSEHLLSIYLDEYQDTPWDALKYLVSVPGGGEGRGGEGRGREGKGRRGRGGGGKGRVAKGGCMVQCV